MAFIETIAPGDSTEQVRAMYERQQSAWGFVPNYAKVFCYRPEVMARWGQLQAEIRRTIDVRRFELITLAAALELRSSACALQFGKKGSEHVGAGEVRVLAQNGRSEAITEAERAMMAFARKVARDASKITAGDVDALRQQGFSEAEIFDIAAASAGRAFFTKILDALGVEPDAPFMAMDESLRELLTVGRPIDFHPPEVMPTAG
jgi:uncharacterized peroxidase-related enzyme